MLEGFQVEGIRYRSISNIIRMDVVARIECRQQLRRVGTVPDRGIEVYDSGRFMSRDPNDLGLRNVMEAPLRSEDAKRNSPKFSHYALYFSWCTLNFQELAHARSHEMPWQDVIDAAFERVPPEFRGTGRSRE